MWGTGKGLGRCEKVGKDFWGGCCVGDPPGASVEFLHARKKGPKTRQKIENAARVGWPRSKQQAGGEGQTTTTSGWRQRAGGAAAEGRRAGSGGGAPNALPTTTTHPPCINKPEEDEAGCYYSYLPGTPRTAKPFSRVGWTPGKDAELTLTQHFCFRTCNVFFTVVFL